LPVELREFVAEFDAGQLPELETQIEQSEKTRFNEVAKRQWEVTIGRSRRVRRLKPSL